MVTNDAYISILKNITVSSLVFHQKDIFSFLIRFYCNKTCIYHHKTKIQSQSPYTEAEMAKLLEDFFVSVSLNLDIPHL